MDFPLSSLFQLLSNEESGSFFSNSAKLHMILHFEINLLMIFFAASQAELCQQHVERNRTTFLDHLIVRPVIANMFRAGAISSDQKQTFATMRTNYERIEYLLTILGCGSTNTFKAFKQVSLYSNYHKAVSSHAAKM